MTRRLSSADVVRASTREAVRALLSAQDYPTTVAVADALGWDAAGQDDHARRTHRMVSEALAEVGVFGEDCVWRLKIAG